MENYGHEAEGVSNINVDINVAATADCWDRDWKGKFPVKWNIVKDVPNSQFQHITINTVENLKQISIIHSRDTQQVSTDTCHSENTFSSFQKVICLF
jgi:hypothetical protein